MRGDAAVEMLDQSIEQFNTTLKAVENASNQAANPQVKATLDHIYGVLLAAQEQVTQAILSTQQKSVIIIMQV
jgi:hypothetical protein